MLIKMKEYLSKARSMQDSLALLLINKQKRTEGEVVKEKKDNTPVETTYSTKPYVPKCPPPPPPPKKKKNKDPFIDLFDYYGK